MTNLVRASHELFRRTPDETFPSLDVFQKHFQWQKEQSTEIWQPPRWLRVQSDFGERLMLGTDKSGSFRMSDWSFSQLCRLSGVAKDTVNRLTPDTATRVFAETLPQGQKPLQLYTLGGDLRSIHAASYTRLHNADLLEVVRDVAGDFEPPPRGFNGATGLYGGEQDMFCFLIDPAGWTEIDGEAFAPGFFLWNSEVGCRSVGIETFCFQAICQNHIVSAEDPHVGSVMLSPDLLHFIGVFALLEAGCREVWLTNGHTVVGIEADDTSDRVETLLRFHANDLLRRFGYSGTAGDRNQHMMTGRVV